MSGEWVPNLALGVVGAWPLLLLSVAAGGAFLLGGASAARQRRRMLLVPDLPGSGETARTPSSDGQWLLEPELRAILNAERLRAAGGFTAFEIAAEPGLAVRADLEALRLSLRLVIRDAAARANGGRVLATASRHGGRVQITVSDDAEPLDRDVQEALLREAQQTLALQGGTLQVESRPGIGSTMRLPEPGPVRAPVSSPERQDQAASMEEGSSIRAL
jgi:hypothetical protein